MIVVATGHRPDKICVSKSLLRGFARHALSNYCESTPTKVVSGMALGWDTAIAEAAIDLGIPLHAFVPFLGQESLWPAEDRESYGRILAQAANVHICCPGGYAPSKFQFRNEKMIREMASIDDRLFELWNGSPGGTANCVAYAVSCGYENRRLRLWLPWLAWKDSQE